MASPFIEDPVEIGARIVRGSLRKARIFRDRQNPLAFPDEFLYDRYRFSSEGLAYLCQLLGPNVSNDTRRSSALTVPQMVCIALRFFATGTFMYAVGDAEHISKNTVCRSIHRVAHALIGLLNVFVVFPGHMPAPAIIEGFFGIAGFPRVLGAIDCMHVPLRSSLGENEGDFLNSKSFHSLNVQMTCDHNCMVTSIDAKWPGSVHDSRIFRESTLCQGFQQGMFSGLLLGDQAYPCQPYLMTPYPDPDVGPHNRFNVALAKTKARIEMTFGLLKARFSCLHGLRVSPERASKIIGACAVLHNIATIRKERTPPITVQPPDVVDPNPLDDATGCAARDAITAQFFS
ncbi:putative nuclease HARBI1 [Dunckerocampus dactyliophorus]|uniref:putative nuclease HARBI1 n=1 Tax=Dunckerocampus dactyliophorus TaxID=161453 RepID=UPI00240738BE|nr:putative nuclease HARBI1 [Dunckerocampus dactyliophorus]